MREQATWGECFLTEPSIVRFVFQVRVLGPGAELALNQSRQALEKLWNDKRFAGVPFLSDKTGIQKKESNDGKDFVTQAFVSFHLSRYHDHRGHWYRARVPRDDHHCRGSDGTCAGTDRARVPAHGIYITLWICFNLDPWIKHIRISFSILRVALSYNLLSPIFS